MEGQGRGGLILTRKVEQSVVLKIDGKPICTVKVLPFNRHSREVRLLFQAPAEVVIVRTELEHNNATT